MRPGILTGDETHAGQVMRSSPHPPKQAVQRGLSVLALIREDGLHPTDDTYNHLFTMCAKAAANGSHPTPRVDINMCECIYTCIYPLSAETLEPLARFVRKLPTDSNLAEHGFPGLINQEFLGSFSTNDSIFSA